MIPKAQALLVLTLGLAPYRSEYFSRLAGSLPRSLQVVILRRSAEVARYSWKKSFRSAGLQIITVSDDRTLAQRQHPDTTLRKGLFQNPPTWRQASEILRRRPALIYSSEASLFCWPALLYSFLAKTPLILETDMGPAIRGRLSLLKRWNQWLFRKQAALIVGRTRDCLRDGPKVIFAPHAVSAARFRPAKKQRTSREPTFLFVGVPSHTKGLDLFARAAGRAGREVGFKCRLVGVSGPQARDLAKNFRAAGFRGPLSFRGFLSGPALRKEYQQADVFVFPSRFDTYGVVVHEATCCGLPVLVSRHAGASQNLVVDGKNGYIIDPENTEQFAARLVELARNPRRLRQMGEESRKLGVRFSVEKQARRVAAKIPRLIGKGATALSRQPRP